MSAHHLDLTTLTQYVKNLPPIILAESTVLHINRIGSTKKLEVQDAGTVPNLAASQALGHWFTVTHNAGQSFLHDRTTAYQGKDLEHAVAAYNKLP